jgi:DNA-binding response OmpR family regulator
MRILLIHDYRDLARGMSLLLEHAGFDVDWTPTGSTALAALAAEPFDLIISDIWLTDTDGFSLMRKIRRRYDTPAIAVSGEFTPALMAEARAAGFAVQALKPIDCDALVLLIRRTLAHSAPAAAAVA